MEEFIDDENLRCPKCGVEQEYLTDVLEDATRIISCECCFHEFEFEVKMLNTYALISPKMINPAISEKN